MNYHMADVISPDPTTTQEVAVITDLPPGLTRGGTRGISYLGPGGR